MVGLAIALPRGRLAAILVGLALVGIGALHFWAAVRLLEFRPRVVRITRIILLLDLVVCAVPWVVMAFDPTRDKWTAIAALIAPVPLSLLLVLNWIARRTPDSGNDTGG